MERNRIAALLLAGMGLLAIPAISFAYMGMAGTGRYNTTIHEQLMDAVESGDYQRWLELRKEYGLAGRAADAITEDNFHLLAEMHRAIREGDFDRAMEIRDELGMGPGWNGRGHRNSGRRHGTEVQETGGHAMGRGNGRMKGGFVDGNGNGICDHAE